MLTLDATGGQVAQVVGATEPAGDAVVDRGSRCPAVLARMTVTLQNQPSQLATLRSVATAAVPCRPLDTGRPRVGKGSKAGPGPERRPSDRHAYGLWITV